MAEKIEETRQYLTFLLGGGEYAFDVLRTREVLTLGKLTRIPCTPNFMSGVINLRGNVVPVINLHEKFELPETKQSEDSAIIIIEITIDQEIVVIGVLVDAVRAVLRFEADQLNPAPKVGMKMNPDMLSAVAHKDDHFIVILNADRIFSAEELSFAREAAVA